MRAYNYNYNYRRIKRLSTTNPQAPNLETLSIRTYVLIYTI